MTQRRLLLGCAMAIAIAFAGTPRHALMAQNNDESKNSAQNNSNPPSSASSDNGSATNNSNNSQSNNTQATGTQSSQNDAQKKQNSNTSSQNDKGTSNNNPQKNDDQSARDRDSKSDTRAANDARNDQNRNADRSRLKSDSRDSQSDRSTDRSNTNNRSVSRSGDTKRDFSRDVKFGQTVSRGLTITSVVPNSVFARSGLRNNDVIVSFNGQRIRNQGDFTRFVVFEPGRRVPVVVYRDGREETIYVVYDNNDAAQGPAGGSPLFGAEFDPQSNDGAVIIRIQKGGAADRAGLQQNDLVVALNGEKVSDGQQATEMVNRLQSGDRVEVEYMRHARAQVTLGSSGAVSDTRLYHSEDRGASVAVGVDTDQTRRDNSADRKDNDRDRRDDRRDGRGILPRLRN